jgi:hypothetical protein
LVPGVEVKMHETLNMVEKVLVGCFHGRKMCDKASRNGLLLIGGLFLLLTRGWMDFFFCEALDVENIMDIF